MTTAHIGRHSGTAGPPGVRQCRDADRAHSRPVLPVPAAPHSGCSI